MKAKTIYLDYAAATPVDDSVLKAMKPYFSEKFYNPSANYLAAKRVRENIIEAKKTIAKHIGAKHSEIIHTSGGTESNNLAISGIMDLHPEKKVLISAIEHESVINPAKKYNYSLIPVNKDGIVNLAKLEEMIDDKVVLISVMLTNNESGTLQPIKNIFQVVSAIRKNRRKQNIELPLYIHTDACQSPCYFDVNTNRLGVDLMTLNGGKIYGPKQSGILYVKSGVNLASQILGGGQQRNMRSGTESPASVVGFANAIEIAVKKRAVELARLASLRNEFISGLKNINSEIIINGSLKYYSPHIVHVTFPGTDNETLLFQLDDKGIMAASGSACSASSDEPSHVLGAMGIKEELSRNSLRFSFGRQTTNSDIAYVLKCLQALLD